jgi:hypothetical protein
MYVLTRNSVYVSLWIGLTIPAFGQVSEDKSSEVEAISFRPTDEPPMLGVHWAKGVSHPEVAHSGTFLFGHRSPDMSYHGGDIMPTATTKAIFWGQSWSNSAFVGDKVTGLDSFYTGFSNSHYAETSDEYTGIGGQVGQSTTHQGHLIDTSAASGGNNATTILNEVCKQISAGNIVPDSNGNGYYPVYTDIKRGNSNYCAYHSSGTCGGKHVEFAFFWDLDGDPGCDPQDTTTGHSQGLAALANVSGHELSEARTDPNGNAWYDSSGEENGDKCAWTFNVPHVAFSNESIWKVQGEWSNSAYNAGTGYPNTSGQKGCLDGH